MNGCAAGVESCHVISMVTFPRSSGRYLRRSTGILNAYLLLNCPSLEAENNCYILVDLIYFYALNVVALLSGKYGKNLTGICFRHVARCSVGIEAWYAGQPGKIAEESPGPNTRVRVVHVPVERREVVPLW